MNHETTLKAWMKKCPDCDGKGYYVASEEMAAHDCPTCEAKGQVPA